MRDLFKEVQTIYNKLADEQSKKVFLARMLVDLCPSKENVDNLAMHNYKPSNGHQFNLNEKDLDIIQEMMATVQMIIKLRGEGKKVMIYGASVWGKQLAVRLYDFGSDFDGFIDRDYYRYPNGVYNKPVYSPEWLLDNKDEIYVAIAATNVYKSFNGIERYLNDNDFPNNQIISTLRKLNHSVRFEEVNHQQYYEFMHLFNKGTAYLDCGGYDGYTSIEFSKHCNGEYSKIYIFEPDEENYSLCIAAQNANQLHDCEVIKAGCSDKKGEILFESGLQGMSRIKTEHGDDSNKQIVSIKTVSIDEIIDKKTVGYIKMDIEGAEMLALIGAAKVIKRDKPLLGICVYHKPGDTIKFINYLKELVPEYRFWLRHYSDDASETVLYAAI